MDGPSSSVDVREAAQEKDKSAPDDVTEPAACASEEQFPAATAHQPPFRSVGFSLSSLGYAVARGFRQTLAPLELEPREFALLRAVGSAEGHSQQEVANNLMIPPSRMVAFVDALEARGLVERRHNPDDRRTRALHLTQAGVDLLARAFSLALQYEQLLCSELRDGERDQLLDLLDRVGKRLGLPSGVHAAHKAVDVAHSALGEG